MSRTYGLIFTALTKTLTAIHIHLKLPLTKKEASQELSRIQTEF